MMPPSDNAAHMLRGRGQAFESCGLRSRASEAALRGVSFRIHVERQRVRGLRYQDPLVGSSQAQARALLRCVQRIVQRVVRPQRVQPRGPSRALRRLDEGTFLIQPFATFELPMEPAPEAARAVYTQTQVEAFVAQVRAADDDPARLRLIEALEAAHEGLPAASATATLHAFHNPNALTGGALCRVLVGRGALRAVQRGLRPGERGRLRALTRGRCGVALDARTGAAAPAR